MSDLILEWLRIQVGCNYLSDLPGLRGRNRERMITLLHDIPPNTATPKEWCEVYHYLNIIQSFFMDGHCFSELL